MEEKPYPPIGFNTSGSASQLPAPLNTSHGSQQMGSQQMVSGGLNISTGSASHIPSYPGAGQPVAPYPQKQPVPTYPQSQPVATYPTQPAYGSQQGLAVSSSNVAIMLQPMKSSKTKLFKTERTEEERSFDTFCMLCQSIYICLCCCWCLGIPSILFAVLGMMQSDNPRQRKSYWRIANILNLVGLLVGIVCFGTLLVLRAAFSHDPPHPDA